MAGFGPARRERENKENDVQTFAYGQSAPETEVPRPAAESLPAVRASAGVLAEV